MIPHRFLQSFVHLEYSNIVEFLYTKSDFSVSVAVIARKVVAAVVVGGAAVVVLVQPEVGYWEYCV